MLDSNTIKKIEGFVYQKPRSIQEIAFFLQKNWRTADRYITEIEKNYGTISTRVFRGGTKGALKIAYWASVEKVSHSVFQEQLESRIFKSRSKDDFSAFDIFQHVPDKNKRASYEIVASEYKSNLQNLADMMNAAKRQMLHFSGNLSFINLKNKQINIFKILDDLVKKGISIKVLCRVDITGRENIEKLLSLNFKHGKDAVEIRHCEQPLRAMIVDNKFFSIKEIKEPTGKTHELKNKAFIFYHIRDKEWTDWLTRIFWKLFSSSIGAEKRLREMQKMG